MWGSFYPPFSAPSGRICSTVWSFPFQLWHFQHFSEEAAIPRQTAGTLQEKHKAAHLLQCRIDLALLLLALESSPITSVWHQRDVFMPLLSAADQHWQWGREIWELAWFLDMFQGRLRASTEKRRVYRQDNGTDLDPRGDNHNHPGSAVCYPKARVAPMCKCMDNYRE